MRATLIDLSQTWEQAPLWIRIWFVLGAIALVGGISWDRVHMQRTADDYIAGFRAECLALETAPATEPAQDNYCRCLLEGIKAEYGTGRVLARQSRYWSPADLQAMGVQWDCQ